MRAPQRSVMISRYMKTCLLMTQIVTRVPGLIVALWKIFFGENSEATATHTNKLGTAEDVAASLLLKDLISAKDVESLLDMTHFRRNISRKM